MAAGRTWLRRLLCACGAALGLIVAPAAAAAEADGAAVAASGAGSLPVESSSPASEGAPQIHVSIDDVDTHADGSADVHGRVGVNGLPGEPGAYPPAPPGTTDPSFGDGSGDTGMVAQEFPNSEFQSAESVLPTDGGGVLAGGRAEDASGFAFGLSKVDAQGNPDPAFGTNGMVRTPIPGASGDISTLLAQPGGQYVAVGTATSDGFPPLDEIVMARYQMNGSLDTSFGTGGLSIVGTIDGHNDISANDAVLTSDAKIVTAGNVLARFDSTGTVDTTFGSNGVFVLDYLAHVLLQDQLGGLYLVGNSATSELLVERRGADGVVDTTFGTGGRVVTDFGGIGAFGLSGLLQPDGKIVAGAAAFTAVLETRFGVIRLLPDGTFDTSFAGDGSRTIDVGPGFNALSAIVRQSNGKLILVGNANGEGNDSDLALVRLNPDGSLDSRFGDGGRVIQAGPTPYNNAEWDAAALAPDGRLITGGNWFDTTAGAPPQQLLIGRYILVGLESLTVRVDGGPPVEAQVDPDGIWWATVTGVRLGSVIAATAVSTEGQTASVAYNVPVTPPAPPAAPTETARAATLPFTGGDPTPAIWLAICALALGAVTCWSSRVVGIRVRQR